MNTNFLEEKLKEVFSTLDKIEGVKSVDTIIDILKDKTIFPEVTTLILNPRFELIYLYAEQKVVFNTVKRGITIDSTFMEEISLINKSKNLIESILNGINATDTIKDYSLELLALKYKEFIQNF